jgi:AcrR family transcriptional regulator
MKDSRQHIIDIALGLFLRKSFKDVTLCEIVKLTGLSKGAFYHYFESKEALLKEVLDQFVLNFMSADWNSLTHNSLLSFIDEYYKLSNERFAKLSSEFKIDFDINYYALFFDAIRIVPEFRETILKKQTSELAAWEYVISKALESGEIHSVMTAGQIARIFVYIPDGYFMQNFFYKGSSSDGKQLGELIDLWKNFYKQLCK